MSRAARLRLAAAVALTLPALAAAHGVWIAQRAGAWALVLGEASVDEAYAAGQVRTVLARTAGGDTRKVAAVAQERHVLLRFDADVAAVAAVFEDGYWSKTRAGAWVAGSRAEVADAERTSFDVKTTTTVVRRLAMPAKAFGLPLEIVPLADPMSLQRVRTLPVRVLFDRRPLAGAKVTADYLHDAQAEGVRTDADGRAELVLGSSGLNVIKVSAQRPRRDRRLADEDGYTATLAFALPPAE